MPTAHRVEKTNPPDQQLTPRQSAATRALAQGATVAEVAALLHLSRRTLARWQRLAAFRAELLRLHRRAARDAAKAHGKFQFATREPRRRKRIPISQRFPDVIPPGSIADRILRELEANRIVRPTPRDR